MVCEFISLISKAGVGGAIFEFFQTKSRPSSRPSSRQAPTKLQTKNPALDANGGSKLPNE
jgi:hypothetical protein